jgi:hypothetical protein
VQSRNIQPDTVNPIKIIDEPYKFSKLLSMPDCTGQKKKKILFIGIMIIITASFGSHVVTPFVAASPQMTALEIT